MELMFNGVVKIDSAEAEYSRTKHGDVLYLAGGVTDRGNSLQIYMDDPAVAKELSLKLFEWAIRVELRRKYDGS